MAIVHKCDRCGTIYEKDYHNPPHYGVVEYGGYIKPDRDMCPECSEKLEHWFENPEEHDPGVVFEPLHEEVKPSFINRIFSKK